jgi:Ca-activated chloride channel family protein
VGEDQNQTDDNADNKTDDNADNKTDDNGDNKTDDNADNKTDDNDENKTDDNDENKANRGRSKLLVSTKNGKNSTVEANREGYNQRQFKNEEKASSLHHVAGRSTVERFRHTGRKKTNTENCDALPADVEVAEESFGPDTVAPNGKSERQGRAETS